LLISVAFVAVATLAPAASASASAACSALVLAPTSALPLGSNGPLPLVAVSGDFTTPLPSSGAPGGRDIAGAVRDLSNRSTTVSVFVGNGDGTYQPAPRTTQVGGWVGEMAVADFNRDRLLDLAMIVDYNAVQVLLSRGDGTFQPAPVVSSSNVQTLAVGDFNGDRIPDIAAAGSGGVTVFPGQGDGKFGAPVSTPTGFVGLYSLVAADLNRDGRLDLAAASLGGVTVLLGNGDGAFGPARGFAIQVQNFEEVISVAVGDVDLDGQPDIVAGSTGNGRVHVFLGTGDGSFRAPLATGTPLDGDFWSGFTARTVSIGDLNGDALPDVVTTNGTPYGVAVLLGRGGGAFAPPLAFPLGFSENVTVQDVNHDSLDDVIATAFTSSGSVAEVFLTRCQPLPARVLNLNGSTGYAQVADSADLNPGGDWTVEMWLKDNDPRGFDHDYVTLINKGDRASSGEAPFQVSLGYKRLLVGQRTGWNDVTVGVDLHALHLDAGRWHHLAATYLSQPRALTVFIDGLSVGGGLLARSSIGNTLPVQIGRNGPGAGKYFRGQLDDVRIWSVARSPDQIALNYLDELSVAPPGLVANWKLNEPSGVTSLQDSARTHTAQLFAGASLASTVRP